MSKDEFGAAAIAVVLIVGLVAWVVWKFRR